MDQTVKFTTAGFLKINPRVRLGDNSGGETSYFRGSMSKRMIGFCSIAALILGEKEIVTVLTDNNLLLCSVLLLTGCLYLTGSVEPSAENTRNFIVSIAIHCHIVRSQRFIICFACYHRMAGLDWYTMGRMPNLS